jgi:NitT/TauT family transport system substrate-binding protein
MQEDAMTRRALVRRGAQGAAGLYAGSLLTATGALARPSVDRLRWISPRGTLQVMDDFNLWVPSKLRYFRSLKLDVELIGGPVTDALASTRLVAQDRADVGYPSPGALAASIDGGIAVKSIWDVISGQVFNFAVKPDSPIESPKGLSGKSIAIGSSSWKLIVDPMLVELGIDPGSVRYVVLGSSWSQAVAAGKADAALTWEGVRAELAAQGLELRHLRGTSWSKHPSNVYAVRAADLEDAAKKDVYTRFLQGVVMGLEFTRANPRAAAQITYRSLPGVQKTLKPQLALDSMLELAHAYGTSHLKGNGWGYNDAGRWAKYLRVIHGLGQTKELLRPADVFTNELQAAANERANRARARADAKAFELDKDFAATKVAAGFSM